MTKQIYVEYYYPGILMSETSQRKVKSRDLSEALRKLPENAFAFRFMERVESKVDGETVRGDFKNYSGMYYPDGTKLSLAEVKKQYKKEKILISNMEINKYDHVVRCRTGNWQPLNKGDQIINIENELKGAL